MKIIKIAFIVIAFLVIASELNSKLAINYQTKKINTMWYSRDTLEFDDTNFIEEEEYNTKLEELVKTHFNDNSELELRDINLSVKHEPKISNARFIPIVKNVDFSDHLYVELNCVVLENSKIKNLNEHQEQTINGDVFLFGFGSSKTISKEINAMMDQSVAKQIAESISKKVKE